jgi:hypothetical protein
MTSTIQQLLDLASQAGLTPLLIGGHAVNLHGHSRTTLDADFLIQNDQLTKWKSLMEETGYRCIHETKAFAQFEGGAEAFRIDLMLVDAATFAKLQAGSTRARFADREIAMIGLLHLIALKLHATRTWGRAVQGKDYYDILALMKTNRVDAASREFLEVLDRYASPTIKERLLRDLAAHG